MIKVAEFVAKNASFAQMVANIIGTEYSAIWQTAQVTFNVFTNFEKCFYVASSIIDYYLFFCQVECSFYLKSLHYWLYIAPSFYYSISRYIY